MDVNNQIKQTNKTGIVLFTLTLNIRMSKLQPSQHDIMVLIE